MPCPPLKPLLLGALCLGLLAACEPEPGEPAVWSVPIKGLPGALLSVWGSASDDIWTVGADTGAGPIIMHYDGDHWQQHSTDARGTLWWVAGRDNDLWMVGDAGLVVHHDRSGAAFDILPAPGPERLYGVLPLAADDIWVVGGNDSDAGVIWRWNGSRWAAPDDLPPDLGDGLAYFKIWGESADDLWIVGEGGGLLHRAGAAWERIPVASKLFTVHGRGPDVLGVGGAFSALMVELTPGRATDVTPKGEVLQLNGVHVGARATVAVGNEGSVWRRAADGSWSPDADAPTVPLDYHATYVDPEGGIWAVGGRLSDLPPTQGLLAHFGSSPVAATIQP